jgi:hypothetical protein
MEEIIFRNEGIGNAFCAYMSPSSEYYLIRNRDSFFTHFTVPSILDGVDR